jgi:hypothetical protein
VHFEERWSPPIGGADPHRFEYRKK